MRMPGHMTVHVESGPRMDEGRKRPKTAYVEGRSLVCLLAALSHSVQDEQLKSRGKMRFKTRKLTGVSRLFPSTYGTISQILQVGVEGRSGFRS